jgi:hypothetical protein
VSVEGHGALHKPTERNIEMGKDFDYREEVKKDIREYLDEHLDEFEVITDDMRDRLYEEMFIADSVTGNGSGSYTFNAYEAECNVAHNLDLLGEALDEFCVDAGTLREKLSGEWADVTIRCYILGEVMGEVFDEWNQRIEDSADESDDEDDEGDE